MQSSDVIIIGGGVIGLAIARCLKRGGRDVTVMERQTPGREASWAAAGMLVPHCESEAVDPFFRLCCDSLAMYPAFSKALYEETGIDIEYRTDGTLYPALNDGEQKGLERRFAQHLERGITVHRLTAKEARRLEPNLTSRLQMALLFPDDHQVENRKLALALVTAVQQAGVKIREGVTVVRLLVEGDRVLGVDTSAGRHLAPIVINAAGSWARYLAGVPARCIPPIRPVRGQMIALSPGDSPPFRHTIYSSKSYLVPRLDGRLLVGATVEEAGFQKDVTVAGTLRLLHGAIEVAPPLRTSPIESTWCGLRPATPDELPILGPTQLIGLIMATGHYRNGILLTPLTGELIADLILTGGTPSAIQPFLIDRFITE